MSNLQEFIRLQERCLRPKGRRYVLRAKPKIVSIMPVQTRFPNAAFETQGETKLEGQYPLGMVEHEFQFWGLYGGERSAYASCRVCGATFSSAVGRKQHMEVTHHTTKLVKAYKLLALDGLCVCCDAKTKDRKWGVPLHKGECEIHFRYSNDSYATIQRAIDISGRW